MKLKLAIVLTIIGLKLLSQPTFTKWINNVEDTERHGYISEFEPGHYLCFLYQPNPNYSLPVAAFRHINNLCVLNDSGNIIDSINIEKFDNYYIMVNNVIKSDNNEILFLCNALNETTFDIQLCLLRTDFNLNIQSYDFLGLPDKEELMIDFCINNNNNIVFIGLGSLEPGEGGHLLWEIDYEGNSINYIVNDTLSLLIPSIIQIPGTGKYHVNDGGGVLIYNMDFEYDTIIILENIDDFLDFPQRHKLIDESRYLKQGMYDVFNGVPPPIDPWDMAILILNDSYQIENTFLFGATDTLDYPNNVDFIDTNRIFLSGVKNYIALAPEDSWLSLYITNLNGDTIQSRFYGGYGLYNTSTGLATSDGGYIIVASWWDFHNYVPPGPADWDIFIMKVDANGLLTGTPPDIPFEQTDIIVYPNPSREYLNIESSLKNLQIKLFNITGELVLERFFDLSIQLNTNNLSTGNYLYMITQDEVLIKRGKWVKQ